MSDLDKAIAETRAEVSENGPYTMGNYYLNDNLDNAKATILNAARSGELITREAAEAENAALRARLAVVEGALRDIAGECGCSIARAALQATKEPTDE